MAKEAKGSNATFTGSNKGLTIIGDHAYAFSGDILAGSTGQAATTMLEFQSPKGYIKGVLSFCEENIAADNVFFRVFLNNVSVINVAYDGSPPYTNINYPILIPPNTLVTVKWGCSTNDEIGTAWFTGKVYS